MAVYLCLFEPKKSAEKNGAVALGRSVEANSIKMATMIATVALEEKFPGASENFFNPKVAEDKSGLPRPPLDEFCDKWPDMVDWIPGEKTFEPREQSGTERKNIEPCPVTRNDLEDECRETEAYLSVVKESGLPKLAIDGFCDHPDIIDRKISPERLAKLLRDAREGYSEMSISKREYATNFVSLWLSKNPAPVQQTEKTDDISPAQKLIDDNPVIRLGIPPEGISLESIKVATMPTDIKVAAVYLFANDDSTNDMEISGEQYTEAIRLSQGQGSEFLSKELGEHPSDAVAVIDGLSRHKAMNGLHIPIIRQLIREIILKKFRIWGRLQWPEVLKFAEMWIADPNRKPPTRAPESTAIHSRTEHDVCVDIALTVMGVDFANATDTEIRQARGTVSAKIDERYCAYYPDILNVSGITDYPRAEINAVVKKLMAAHPLCVVNALERQHRIAYHFADLKKAAAAVPVVNDLVTEEQAEVIEAVVDEMPQAITQEQVGQIATVEPVKAVMVAEHTELAVELETVALAEPIALELETVALAEPIALEPVQPIAMSADYAFEIAIVALKAVRSYAAEHGIDMQPLDYSIVSDLLSTAATAGR